MSKYILFTLNPWLEEDNKGLYYCPACGVVEGFLAYAPEVRDQIEINYIDFQGPRHKVIDYLGTENQGCPVLVFDESLMPPEGSRKSSSTGKSFIDDANTICHFLGKTFGSARPHP